MSDYIKLDGVSSETKGIYVLDWQLPLSPKRNRQTETISGRITSIEFSETLPPDDVILTLAIVGDSQAQIRSTFRTVSSWLWHGTRLEISDMPGCYYTGYMARITEGDVTDAYMTVKATFTANPPYIQHACSKQSGFIPSDASPIQEQITSSTETASKAFTSSGRLPIMTDAGMDKPALYFAVTGTWTQLSIGDLVITEAMSSQTTVYIDCELQVVYRISAGARVAVAYSGDFPANDAQGIQVGGTAFSATVRALMIERG